MREFVTLALEARTKANIKVKQPLPALTINIELEAEYAHVLRDEINVKEIHFNADMQERAVLDTTITSELKREGDVRELMRKIQDTRKEMGLVPEDRIILTVSGALKTLVEGFEKEVCKTTGVSEIRTGTESNAHTLEVDGVSHTFAIEKA